MRKPMRVGGKVRLARRWFPHSDTVRTNPAARALGASAVGLPASYAGGTGLAGFLVVVAGSVVSSALHCSPIVLGPARPGTWPRSARTWRIAGGGRREVSVAIRHIWDILEIPYNRARRSRWL